MRLALALFAACLLAAPAQAATYWVAPDSASALGAGSPYMNGSDSALTAFPNGPKTLAWFNENAQPGDVCRFKSGSYGQVAIDPRNRNTTSALRIRYYGFPQDPGAVRVANVQIGESAGRWGSYITVKWVTTTSGFAGVEGWASGGVVPTGDSLVNCRSAVANSVSLQGHGCVLDSLTLSGTNTTSGVWFSVNGAYGCNDPATTATELCANRPILEVYETVRANRITNSTFTVSRPSGTNDWKLFRWTAADSTLFFNNTVNCTLSTTTGGFMGLELYMSKYSQIQGNTWNFVMNATPAGTHAFWSLRDSSRNNRFVSNTVTATGSGACSFMPTNAGSFPAGNGRNYYGYNTLKVATPQASAGVLWFQDGMQTDTLEANTVATSSTEALLNNAGSRSDGAVVRHNTFLTAGATAVRMLGTFATASVPPRLVANVYYCQSANSASVNNVMVHSGVALDSAGVYFSLGSPQAVHAVRYGNQVGAPGSGNGLGGTQSVWGSPRLADSTYAALDGRVLKTGYAVGSLWNDGYAGIGISDADVTAPAVAITYPADTSYTWTANETMPLAWTASDAVGVTSIVVQYGSTDDPSTEPTSWSTVTTLAGGTTSYNWTMASVATRYGYVRVRALDAAGNVGGGAQVYKFNRSPDEPGRGTSSEGVD